MHWKKAFQTLNRRRKLILKISEESSTISENDYSLKPASMLSSGLILISSHFDKPTNAMAKRFSEAIASLYSEEKIGKFVVVYNKFQSAMSQVPTSDVVLPLHIGTASVDSEPIFEPEVDELLNHVVPRYMTSRIFKHF